MDTHTQNLKTTHTARRTLRAASILWKHVRNTALVLFTCVLALQPAFADERGEERADEVARLKEEIAKLRAECQELRMMLAEPAQAPDRPATNRVVVVVEENTTETALLRAECQALRLMLASPAILAQPQPNAEPVEKKSEEPAPPQADTTLNAEPASPVDIWLVALPPGFTHWLTASSGVRHNSQCSNFHKTVGRPCKAGDGRPCGRCGG